MPRPHIFRAWSLCSILLFSPLLFIAFHQFGASAFAQKATPLRSNPSTFGTLLEHHRFYPMIWPSGAVGRGILSPSQVPSAFSSLGITKFRDTIACVLGKMLMAASNGLEWWTGKRMREEPKWPTNFISSEQVFLSRSKSLSGPSR
jgi:hypothetical protein